jgi:hypothetical protein
VKTPPRLRRFACRIRGGIIVRGGGFNNPATRHCGGVPDLAIG